MHWILMNDKEFGSRKLWKLKYRRGNQIIQTFCKIGSPPEIRSLLFNLYKFENPEKSTPESYKMLWNRMNDEEFGSKNVSKSKYRRGGPNYLDILQNWFSPEIRSFSVICRNFRTLRKAFLIHAEWTEIYWWTKSLDR